MKSDKELAVELAVASISIIPAMNAQQSGQKQPLSGADIKNILRDCYFAVRSLDSSQEDN